MSLSFANLFRLGGEKNVPPSIFRPLSFPLSLSFSLREERVTRKWKISFVSQRVFLLLPPAYFNIWTRRNEAWREKRWKHPLKGTLMRMLSTSRNHGPILCTHPCIVFAPMIERRLDDSIISRICDYLACFPIPLDSVFGPVSFPGWNTSTFYWGKESFESGFHRGKRTLRFRLRMLHMRFYYRMLPATTLFQLPPIFLFLRYAYLKCLL